MNRNPFNFSKSAKKKDFHNRKEEIEIAISLLKRLQSFSVIGEDKIGKTSFLLHLLSREMLKEYKVNPEKYIIIYFDLGGFYNITRDALIEAIVVRIQELTQIEIEAKNVFEKLDAYIERLALDDKNLVIALDEFEIIAPILDDHFSHWLRFVFQSPNVIAVTASRMTVGEVERPTSMASPLFNIFGNLRLGLFPRTEARVMIEEMFQKGGMELEEEEISFLVNLSGGNPYLIQLVGYHYYEERKKNREIILERFEERMLYYAKDQFEGNWKYLTEEEKKCLLQLDNMDDRICHLLERKGYLTRENEIWKVFSNLFKNFLCTKKETRGGRKWNVSSLEILGAIVVSAILLYFLLKAFEIIDPLDPSEYWNLILQSIVIIVTLTIFIWRAYRGSIESLQNEINRAEGDIYNLDRRIDLMEKNKNRLDNDKDRLTQMFYDMDQKLAILLDRLRRI